MSNRAKRYNKGKNRLELFPQFAIREIGEVYTRGAHKYSVYKDQSGGSIKGSEIPIEEVHLYELIEDGGENWRLGQNWKGAIASVKRHILSWEEGEDKDELGTLHLANAAWGLMQILEYYKIFPQGDDRTHSYLKVPKIGLDVDEVCADWVGHWCKKYNKVTPENWNFDRDIEAKFEESKTDKDFWMSIPVKTRPQDIPFEPHCYITSRSIPVEWTIEWLDKNGFPAVPVHSISHKESKVEAAKKAGIEVFVDDRFENFVELNKAGICCYLFSAPHNKRYSVGHKRIDSLADLPFFK